MRQFLYPSLVLLVGCAAAGTRQATAPTPQAATAESTSVMRPQYPSTYQRHPFRPVVIRNGHYAAPLRPGMSAQLHQESIDEFSYPNGAAWAQ